MDYGAPDTCSMTFLTWANAPLVSYVLSRSSDFHSRVIVTSPSWGLGRVPCGFMGTEEKTGTGSHGWHTSFHFFHHCCHYCPFAVIHG